jgi:NAD(P)-dependent dehydrogenase (short-subunit alcohol dehydrogenase family)
MSQLRVVVIGGGRGIGRAIALRFAREGAKVAVLARTATELDLVVKEINSAGGEGDAGQMNLQDVGDIGAAMWRAVQFLGDSIDVLVNSAGAFDIKPFAKIDPRSWQRMIDVNLTGPFHAILESLDAIKDGERPIIININSLAGREAFPGNTAYCASKYGLRGFTDALRLDLADDGVRVSSIFAGPTDTSIWDEIEGDWDRSKMNRPEDVAEVVWNVATAPDGEDVDNVDVPPPA